MNEFDDINIDTNSFAFLNAKGVDGWQTFTPVFGALTVIGATSYSGRYRMVGRKCEFQVQLSAVTSIASVAGTDYLNLPFAAAGLTGHGVMTNKTTNIAVGLCHVDVVNSRCYLPTQVASANVFHLNGSFEV